MPIKMTGEEWKRFLLDPLVWGDETWQDEVEIIVDGVPSGGVELSALDDRAVVVLSGGTFYFDGKAEDTGGVSIVSRFRQWRKSQDTVILVCECRRANVDSVKLAVMEAGGKVKS